jgi:hypothetical protein
MQRQAALAEAAAKKRAVMPGSAPATRPPVPAPYRFSWRSLPRDIKLMAIGLVVVLLAGLGWLFVPRRANPITPLLGWSEPTSPRKVVPPTPRPTPTPVGKKKKGWLPW